MDFPKLSCEIKKNMDFQAKWQKICLDFKCFLSFLLDFRHNIFLNLQCHPPGGNGKYMPIKGMIANVNDILQYPKQHDILFGISLQL